MRIMNHAIYLAPFAAEHPALHSRRRSPRRPPSHRTGRRSRCACWSDSPPAATSTISRASPARGCPKCSVSNSSSKTASAPWARWRPTTSCARPPTVIRFFWAGTGTVSIFPAMGKAPYSMKDLAPVSLIGTSPQVLIINGKLPIKTLQEFVAWVKPKPKKFAYAGGGGPGSVSNLLMALFLKRAGIGDECRELSRHRAGAHRHHRRSCARDVHSAAGSAAACRDRRRAHARAVGRSPRRRRRTFRPSPSPASRVSAA